MITVRTPGDFHTFIVRPAQSPHENNEETQNLNQGNTNENEGPSKSSNICGICIVFYLFFRWQESYDKLLSKIYSSLLLISQFPSNTEPVVYTTTQQPDPDFHNDLAFGTWVRIQAE